MSNSRDSRKDDRVPPQKTRPELRLIVYCLVIGLLSRTLILPAQTPVDAGAPRKKSDVSGRSSDRALLAPQEWSRLDLAVNRGIAFIAKSQVRDGSFPTADDGQPGVTGLCILALLARTSAGKRTLWRTTRSSDRLRP